MNVLQLISPSGFYGAERWILALARHANTFGIRCHLAVTSESSDTKIEILERYPTSAGESIRLEMRHRFDRRVLAELRELTEQMSIDIVHTHGYKSDTIGRLATQHTNALCISTAHGYTKVTSIKDRLYHLVGNACLRRMDQVVPLSNELFEELIRRGVDESKLTLIGNGVDVEEIDEVLTNNASQKSVDLRQTIGYVGQLVPRKRVDLLLQIFARLWMKDNRRTLRILGDGPERERLQTLASSLPCADAVRFEGFVERRLEAMAGFSLMIMTSEVEGVPRTLMEAMAMGVPCAAFAIRGIDELIVDEQSGMLSADGDIAALEAGCERILSDHELSQRLIVGGRARIESDFSAYAMTSRYESLFSDLLRRGSSTMSVKSSGSRSTTNGL